MDASTLTPLVGDFSITGARAVMLMVMMVHQNYKNQRSELMGDGAPVSEKIQSSGFPPSNDKMT